MRARLYNLFLGLLVSAALPAVGFAQGAVWGETTVTITPVPEEEEEAEESITLEPGEVRVEGDGWALVPTDESSPQARVLEVGNMPRARTYAEMQAFHARIQQATVPVRAMFSTHPLIQPGHIEVVGAATLVELEDGTSVLITASHLVNGASQVEIQDGQGWHTADVTFDADLGLARIESTLDVSSGRAPLSLAEANAETVETTYGAGSPGPAGTLGPGDGIYGFYQMNTSGAVLGYPLVDRDGRIIGIGSHRYPPNPSFTLSVSAASVRDFLDR